ncbi:Transcriptional regulatory protein KdpE [bacterium HR24]|nr:Transcriptional regulatory protein KdpE [bacterium HR24]
MKGPAALVLVCEDDSFGKRVERWLAKKGYEVVLAEDWWEAYRCIYVSRPAGVLVVTDRLSRELRDFVHTVKRMTSLPLLLVSYSPSHYLLNEARTWPLDYCLLWEVNGEEAPSALEEALQGLSAVPSSQLVYEDGDLYIDFRSMSVLANGRPVHLTPTEFRVLALLVGRRGWVVTHDEILAHVWGSEYVGDRGLVKLYIWYLRRKLEPDPRAPTRIVTRRGVGYMFRPQTAALQEETDNGRRQSAAPRPGQARDSVRSGA